MKPTTEEMLRSFKVTLETVIIPDLQSPWPQASAHSMTRLIDHLLARIEKEDALVMSDNENMRALLTSAGQPPSETGTDADVQGGHLCTDLLKSENERLRLHIEKLLSEGDEAIVAKIRALLRSQTEAEWVLIEPLFAPAG